MKVGLEAPGFNTHKLTSALESADTMHKTQCDLPGPDTESAGPDTEQRRARTQRASESVVPRHGASEPDPGPRHREHSAPIQRPPELDIRL